MTTVVAVSGSRREGSYTRAALRYALDAADEAGADTDFIDLGAVDLPLYHPDIDEQGDSPDLLRRVREADGVIVGSPVYHGSYSSTFKNFHDYCSFDEYEDTAVGLLAVAGGGSYGSTLEHLRSTVRGVHGFVIPHQVGIRSAYEKFEEVPSIQGDGEGIEYEFVDEPLRERTEKLGRKVAAHAALLRRRPEAADASE
ncbi:NADPH-dependent FMN reductase [Halegenticoccus soli]|uniref:NADPH-dependent FMN reductase n=1 Tax=Halegenticoccus soli TaxID=1985678 RepID=UPI000C6EE42C|nr:NAD(P)H-dependent oxidoreductase [Halegenticoccus soli]